MYSGGGRHGGEKTYLREGLRQYSFCPSGVVKESFFTKLWRVEGRGVPAFFSGTKMPNPPAISAERVDPRSRDGSIIKRLAAMPAEMFSGPKHTAGNLKVLEK